MTKAQSSDQACSQCSTCVANTLSFGVKSKMGRCRHGNKNAEDARTDSDSKQTKRAVAGGLMLAADAAFALAKQLSSLQLKAVQTIVLRSDNGTEAHIRPLGCCIQSMSPFARPGLRHCFRMP